MGCIVVGNEYRTAFRSRNNESYVRDEERCECRILRQRDVTRCSRYAIRPLREDITIVRISVEVYHCTFLMTNAEDRIGLLFIIRIVVCVEVSALAGLNGDVVNRYRLEDRRNRSIACDDDCT